jgi:DNA-binding transcriptional ArsR family regulator
MKPDEMDAVFAALASEPRRRVLDVLKRSRAAT